MEAKVSPPPPPRVFLPQTPSERFLRSDIRFSPPVFTPMARVPDLCSCLVVPSKRLPYSVQQMALPLQRLFRRRLPLRVALPLLPAFL